jgi:glycosyltransferase involved in cell wall biosynthesis
MQYFPQLTGKRILLVSHELSQTGAPLLLIETGRALLESGARVALTSPGSTDPVFRRQTVAGFRIVPADESFIEADNADLIIANTAVTREWVNNLLALHPGAGAKLVWWIHEMETENYGRGMDSLAEAGAVIFDSQASCRLWQQTGLRMPATVRVIYPGLSSDFLRDAEELGSPCGCSPGPEQEPGRLTSRETIRKRLRVSSGDFLVSLFGTYCLRKGHNLLVGTVGRMLDANPGLGLKILLIGFRGESQRQGFLNSLSAAESLALSKHRALRLVSDLKPYYLASDALVMNTQDQGETFGRVTIEAMAFRLPVLGSDCGGTPEIVIDGVTGLLHPSGKFGQAILAGNIRHLVNNRKEAATLGEAGFQRVSNQFTEARFCKELAETIDAVTKNSRTQCS